MDDRGAAMVNMLQHYQRLAKRRSEASKKCACQYKIRELQRKISKLQHIIMRKTSMGYTQTLEFVDTDGDTNKFELAPFLLYYVNEDCKGVVSRMMYEEKEKWLRISGDSMTSDWSVTLKEEEDGERVPYHLTELSSIAATPFDNTAMPDTDLSDFGGSCVVLASAVTTPPNSARLRRSAADMLLPEEFSSRRRESSPPVPFRKTAEETIEDASQLFGFAVGDRIQATRTLTVRRMPIINEGEEGVVIGPSTSKLPEPRVMVKFSSYWKHINVQICDICKVLRSREGSRHWEIPRLDTESCYRFPPRHVAPSPRRGDDDDEEEEEDEEADSISNGILPIPRSLFCGGADENAEEVAVQSCLSGSQCTLHSCASPVASTGHRTFTSGSERDYQEAKDSDDSLDSERVVASPSPASPNTKDGGDELFRTCKELGSPIICKEGSTTDLLRTCKEGSTADLLQTSKEGSTTDLLRTCKGGSTTDLLQTCKGGSTTDLLQTCKEGSTTDLLQTCKEGISAVKGSVEDELWDEPPNVPSRGGSSEDMRRGAEKEYTDGESTGGEKGNTTGENSSEETHSVLRAGASDRDMRRRKESWSEAHYQESGVQTESRIRSRLLGERDFPVSAYRHFDAALRSTSAPEAYLRHAARTLAPLTPPRSPPAQSSRAAERYERQALVRGMERLSNAINRASGLVARDGGGGGISPTSRSSGPGDSPRRGRAASLYHRNNNGGGTSPHRRGSAYYDQTRGVRGGEAQMSSSPCSSHGSMSSPRGHALVAAPSAVTRQVLSMLLRSLHFEVTTTTLSPYAVRFACRDPPTVAILDCSTASESCLRDVARELRNGRHSTAIVAAFPHSSPPHIKEKIHALDPDGTIDVVPRRRDMVNELTRLNILQRHMP